MSVAYNKLFQEVANELGAIKGNTASDAETNYTSTISTSTLKGPDFTPTMIQDAVVNAIGKIAQAIIETPRHVERVSFIVYSLQLSSGAPLPAAISGAGTMGNVQLVRDWTNSTPLEPTSLDKVRGYNLHKTGIYTGLDIYLYAIVGNNIYHTRTAVSVEMTNWTRPTSFAGDMSLRDYHERAVVMGAVAMLAPKEGMFGNLQQAAEAEFMQHLASIRAQGAMENYGAAGKAASIEE